MHVEAKHCENILSDKSAGFTFVELCLALTVSGIVFLSLIAGLQMSTKNIRIEQEKRLMTNASEAIEYFFNQQTIYPCPANPNLPETDANYGLADCNLPKIQGARDGNRNGSIAGDAQDSVLIGMMPIYSCVTPVTVPLVAGDPERCPKGADEKNRVYLSEDVAEFDIMQTNYKNPWGTNLTYAVNYGVTQSVDEDLRKGTLKIIDHLGDDTAGTVEDAIYVIISHGQNGCNAATVHPMEEENCNNDAVFRDTMTNTSDRNNYENFFDDRMKIGTSMSWQMWADLEVTDPWTGKTSLTSHKRLYYQGNLGIKTNNPTDKVDVNGDAYAKNYVRSWGICEDAQDPKKCIQAQSVYNVKCDGSGEYLDQIAINNYSMQAVCKKLKFVTPAADNTCAPGTFLQGMYTDGTLVCN